MRIGMPDMVVQTGATAGKGFRPDTMLGYDDEERARRAASKSGLNPNNAVKKMTVGELLDFNKKYKQMIVSAGLAGEGDDFDLNKEVYVIREGLKVSVQPTASDFTIGSAHLSTIHEQIDSFLADQNSSPWISQVSTDLGIQNQQPVAQKVSKFLNEKLGQVDTVFDNAVKVNIVDKDTSENLAVLSAKEIMSQLRRQGISGEALKSDELYQLVSDFASRANDPRTDNKVLDRYKARIKEAMTRRLIMSKLDQSFQSNSLEDRQAGALLVGLVGGSDFTQSVHYMGINKGGKHFLGDHNTIALSGLRGLINKLPGYSYKIRKASGSNSISVKTAGGSTINTRFRSGGLGATSAYTTANIGIFEEHGYDNFSEYNPQPEVMSEVIKMLKSQLTHLHRIFG